MNKRYWWIKVKIEDSSYSTDKEKLINLIKEGNYIYFEYCELDIKILITPNTKIEVRDPEIFITYYYQSSNFLPKYWQTGFSDFFDLDSPDFRYKLITREEFQNLIRKNP